MNGLVLAAGGGVGAGVALVVRGMVPPRPPLAQTIAALRQRRVGTGGPDPRPPWDPSQPSADHPAAPASGWAARAGRPAAAGLARVGLPTARTRADLALLDRPAAVHLAEQATTAVVGTVVVPAVAGILAVAGVDTAAGWVLPAWGCLLLGAAGFAVPTFGVRANAAARRAEFVHALGSFLDLVVIGLAGGAGVEAALTQASSVGHGWAFDRLRHALQVARITRTTPWAVLAELGVTLQVPVLREVAAAVGLAGTEGAKVRTSLAAKASGLRLRELTSAEAAAASATEQMTLPVIVMFAGFLLFIGFPAVNHVLGAL